MKWKVFAGIMFACLQLSAQQFSIFISDNRGSQKLEYNYNITNDSLIITGISDYGKTEVNYLSRKHSKEQVQSLNNFFKTFLIDNIQESYAGEFTNFKYITADHCPRVIELKIYLGEKKVFTKITNAYVKYLSPFFDEINSILPDEVRFKLQPDDFGATY
jgi:hypothetical protein